MDKKNICMVTCTLPLDNKMVQIWNNFSEELEKRDYQLVFFTPDSHSEINFECVKIPFSLDQFDGFNFFIPSGSFLSESTTALSMAQREIQWFNKDKKEWAKHFRGYYKCEKFYRSIIQSLKPSMIIAWQNSLPQSNILKRLAEEYSIPNAIIERGMLPDTVMLEQSGNVSLSDIANSFSLREIITSHTCQDNYENIKEYYLDKKPTKYDQKSYSDSLEELNELKSSKKPLVVYFGNIDSAVGAFPEDTMLAKKTNEVFFDTSSAITSLSDLSEKLNFDLLVKIHPKEENNYGQYSNSSTKILKDFSYHALMEAADVLVFSCTTLQFEALLYEKPIVLLSNTELSGYDIAYEVNSDTYLSQLLESAIKKVGFSKKLENAKKYLDWVSKYFLFNYYEKSSPIRHSFSDLSDYIAKTGIKNTSHEQPDIRISRMRNFLKAIESGYRFVEVAEEPMDFLFGNNEDLMQAIKNCFEEYEYSIDETKLFNRIEKLIPEKDEEASNILEIIKEIKYGHVKQTSLGNSEEKKTELEETKNQLAELQNEVFKMTSHLDAYRIKKLQIANDLLKSEDYDAAGNTLIKLLEVFPNDLKVLLGLGHLLFIKKEYEGAIEYYKHVFSIDPNNAEAFEKLNLIQETVTPEAVLQEGDNEKLRQAEDFLSEGKVDEAEKILLGLYEIAPNNLEVLNDLAAVRVFQNNIIEALQIIKEVLDVDPSNEVAIENYEYIKTLPEFTEAKETEDVESDYEKKLKDEISIYENQAIVHNLPKSHDIYSAEFLTPNLKKITGFSNSNDWWVDEIDNLIEKAGRTIKILSLGCGNGDFEINLLKRVKRQDRMEFVGIDINPSMLKRGRELAAKNGMPYMQFELQDLNKLNLQDKYDVYIANHSLHHMVELEHIFNEMSKAASEDMIFVINDMIGRNGHMMWDNTEVVVDEIWDRLDDKYKINAYSKKLDMRIMNIDCSLEGFEGIRAEDILPLLIKYFDIAVYLPFGSIVNRFVDRAYGHNFDTENKDDIDIINKIIKLDEKLLAEGKLAPCQAFIKCINKDSSNEGKYLFQSPKISLEARNSLIKTSDYIYDVGVKRIKQSSIPVESITEENILQFEKSDKNYVNLDCGTFSENTFKLYNKSTSLDSVKNAFEILKKHNLGAYIELTSFNPLESIEDKQATFNFLLTLDKNTIYNSPKEQSWYLRIMPFTLSSDSELFNMCKSEMKEDGEFYPVIENPQVEEFWEVMYKLTMYDFLPKEELVHLSKNCNGLIKQFEIPTVENGIEFIVKHLINSGNVKQLNELNNELIMRMLKMNSNDQIKKVISKIEFFTKKYLKRKSKIKALSVYDKMLSVADFMKEENDLNTASYLLEFLLGVAYRKTEVQNKISDIRASTRV